MGKYKYLLWDIDGTVLDFLAAEKAAITNGTKIAQTKKLANSGLELIFDKVFISEELGFEKPDRRFFERVIEELNIGELGQALIIGDSLTSDIKGAALMGIDSCWYNPKAKENTSDLRPDFEIADLHELEKII